MCCNTFLGWRCGDFGFLLFSALVSLHLRSNLHPSLSVLSLSVCVCVAERHPHEGLGAGVARVRRGSPARLPALHWQAAAVRVCFLLIVVVVTSCVGLFVGCFVYCVAIVAGVKTRSFLSKSVAVCASFIFVFFSLPMCHVHSCLRAAIFCLFSFSPMKLSSKCRTRQLLCNYLSVSCSNRCACVLSPCRCPVNRTSAIFNSRTIVDVLRRNLLCVWPCFILSCVAFELS